MTASAELSAILQDLVERWCDRRALGPIRHLLATFPVETATSDEWHRLWGALQHIRGFGEDVLPAGERQRVEAALRLLDQALRTSGQVPRTPGS